MNGELCLNTRMKLMNKIKKMNSLRLDFANSSIATS